MTDETGMALETMSKGVAPEGEDFAYDASDGKCIAAGLHVPDIIRGSSGGVFHGNTGLAAAVVGGIITLANSVAVCGHAATSRTTVCTGIEMDKPLGRLLRYTINWMSLPFATS